MTGDNILNNGYFIYKKDNFKYCNRIIVSIQNILLNSFYLNKENVNNLNKLNTKYATNPYKSMIYKEKITEVPKINKGYLM